jgi:hypothetical protein
MELEGRLPVEAPRLETSTKLLLYALVLVPALLGAAHHINHPRVRGRGTPLAAGGNMSQSLLWRRSTHTIARLLLWNAPQFRWWYNGR